MKITFDPDKNARNVALRGLSFDEAIDFDFQTALVQVDDRRDYGEKRLVALGYLGRRLHVLCFVEIPGGIRVISFRKANAREVRRHAQIEAPDRR
ncbi:MAG: BrnT family toxin [Alphaproteobacteria bacterium]|nr:BrnT family toxin [Alphaproteobacteria bacterium]